MDSGADRGGIGAAGSRHAALVAALVAIAAFAFVAPATAEVPDARASIPDAALQTAPTAALTLSPNPAHPGEPVVLDGRESTAPDSAIQACEFDVDGDGTYDVRTADCVVDYTYQTRGEYDLRVRVTTTDGRTATDSATLVVRENDPPMAGIAVDPAEARPGEAVTLSGADSSDVDGDVVAYRWELPQGTAAGETVTTSFDRAGEYEVVLTVTDDDGANASRTAVVTVRANQPPAADLELATTSPTVGEPVRLDAGGSSDADGDVVGYRWDVDGDGRIDRTTESATLSFVPDGPGTREVTVTVVDDEAATDTAVRAFTVAAPATASPTPTRTAAPPTTEPADRDGGVLAGVPDVLALLLLLALFVGGVGIGVRRRAAVASRFGRLRDLLTRGDVRRNLARKVSGTAVKTAAKRAVRRLSDLVEGGGTGVGEAIERLGRAIKRGSERVAAWLRRLGT